MRIMRETMKRIHSRLLFFSYSIVIDFLQLLLYYIIVIVNGSLLTIDDSLLSTAYRNRTRRHAYLKDVIQSHLLEHTRLKDI